MSSTYRKKKKKAKRKLRKLTSIMPMLEWRPDIERTHMFRMPFKVGGMKDLQLHTPIKSKKKKVWANVYQKLSHLPNDMYMKNIEFGFIPKDNYMGWNVDKHSIVWIDRQVQIPINEVIGLAFKGTAITYTEWEKTYNPYDKYNKFIIDILRNNKRVQTSLPSLMQGYKDSGTWDEIRSVRKDIWDVATSDTLGDMWNYLSGNQFIVPNPITSMRILLNDITRDEKIYFNFILSKDTMKRHTLSKHIASPPKPLSLEKMRKKIGSRLNPEARVEFDEHYERYVREGEEEQREDTLERDRINSHITNALERDRILRDTAEVVEEWDGNPILLTPEQEDIVPRAYLDVLLI